METVLSIILSAVLSLQTGVTSLWDKKQPVSAPESDVISTMCLTDKVAQNGIEAGNVRVPKILKSIKKVDRSNTTEAYEIEKCQGQGSCGSPSVADYRLVATNVRIDHIIYPNAFEKELNKSDRQLVKQLDFTDNQILKDRYKNRIYRTFCGDWCYTCPPPNVSCDREGLNCTCSTSEAVSLPYRGSFHCDFVFYLQDEDEKGNPQLDEYGSMPPLRKNTKDQELPTDKSLFSVYFRIGASLPDNIRCQEKSDNGKIQISSIWDKIIPLFGVKSIYAQSGSGSTLVYPPSSKTYYLFEPNPKAPLGSYKARNTQITTEVMQKVFDPKTGRNTVADPVGKKGTFEVYRNVLDPTSNDYIYLIEAGKMQEMLSGLSNTASPEIKIFEYYRFSLLNTTEGSQKTIKLGRFKPIVAKNWVSKWAEESKPAIYIYPPKEMDLTVKLYTKGKIILSDPPYTKENGWKVTVKPDGTIKQCDNERMKQCHSYPYLFYEANLEEVKIEAIGKVVAFNDLLPYLSESLKKLGLNKKEIEDFFAYWIPRLSSLKAPYFLVHFLDNKQIELLEPMELSAKIDSAIRIRAYFKPLDYPMTVKRQILEKSSGREGLTVVEWGGILDKD